jgi:hypothetical protein
VTQRVSEDKKLKNVFKEALREVLDERKDMLRDILQDALEDIAMVRAIQEGRRTGDATRSEIFSILESAR